jgi:SMODS-associating 2TM, beta-strand rich effector domain
MWSLVGHKTQVLILVATGIVIAWALDAAYTIINGHSAGVLHWISFASFIVGVIFFLIAEKSWRWIWRKCHLLNRLIFPDLNGTWTGTLVSTWIDPTTGQPKPAIPTTIIIRQTLLKTTVSLSTTESTSHSTRAFLEPHRDIAHFKIWYSYNNDPMAQHRHRSSPHEGVAFLALDLDSDPTRLTGRYYTARKTTGDIDVRKAKA